MPRRLSVLVLSLVLVAAVPALTAAARAAQDDGVRIDPDSPPATEYELPLDAARGVGTGTGTAGGGTSSGSGADGRPPAFGSGITPKPAAAPSGPRTRDGGSAANGSEGAGTGTGTGAGAAGDATGAPANGPSPSINDGNASPVLYSLGGALLVLVAGGVIALTLRRRQSTA